MLRKLHLHITYVSLTAVSYANTTALAYRINGISPHHRSLLRSTEKFNAARYYSIRSKSMRICYKSPLSKVARVKSALHPLSESRVILSKYIAVTPVFVRSRWAYESMWVGWMGDARRRGWSNVYSLRREAIGTAILDGAANDGQFVDTLIRRWKWLTLA